MAAYRTSGSVPCPKCRMPMVDADGGLACPSQCGMWFPRATLFALLGIETLVGRHHNGAFWKVTQLGALACPICERALEPCYPEVTRSDVLTIGECADHGAWLARRDRVALEAAFATELKTWRSQDPASRPKLAAPPTKPDLESRVHQLETVVRELLARIVDLERRV